ncbi:putative helicase/SANT-associated, DNA-binding protein [Sesbania bispinosa]|nr:putative helicase/SANT-associated, DNA-binding protein [Sesbania bispinosa]
MQPTTGRSTKTGSARCRRQLEARRARGGGVVRQPRADDRRKRLLSLVWLRTVRKMTMRRGQLLVAEEEERAHDDGLRNHDDAAKGERHLAQWRWYGWWQHRSGCGEEEDAPVCVTATIVARLEQGSALVVNAEVDSMGGVRDGGVGIGLKTSPRRAAIEKAQAELRQEYDVREERRRELEFIEKGGNPLDFKSGNAASVSVQSTSLTDQHQEQFVTSHYCGSVGARWFMLKHSILRMNQVDHKCYYPTSRVMACIFWFG